MGLADVKADKFFRKILSGCGFSGDQLSTACDAYHGRELVLFTKAKLHGILQAWADLFSFHLTPEFLKWVEEFRPEVVYSPLGSIRQCRLVLAVSEYLRLPIVPHFMDDWPSTHYSGDPAVFLPRLVLKKSLNRLVKGSRRHGDRCCDGRGVYTTLRGPVPGVPEHCRGPPRTSSPPGSPAQSSAAPLVRRGAAPRPMGVAQGNARALTGLPDLYGAEVVIYAPQPDLERYGAVLTGTPGLKVVGSLRAEDVPRVLFDADVLVHVESFDPAARRYTRLSVSTKIPQYMAAGRAILGYGPGEGASCQYIVSTGSGRVVGERDPAALRACSRDSPLRGGSSGAAGPPRLAGRPEGTQR